MRLLAACLIALGALGLAGAARPAPLASHPLAARAAAQPTAADGLVTYHYDLSRSGYDPNEPAFSGLTGRWASATLDGAIYAEPLVFGGRVYVVTEHNAVYAFDTASGTLLWQRSAAASPLGAYVTNPGGCGISQAGIASTPVIDPAAAVLYLVALTTPASEVYQLFALNLASGATVGAPRVLDADPAFAHNHQQRGALALNNGMVYVPFGGWGGDCGTYRGTVIGVPVAGGGLLRFQVPTGAAGIWAPGGPAVDAAGNVYVADGNDIPTPNTYQFGDSVLRLSPTLSFSQATVDYWAPSDWRVLSISDNDTGGIGPTLLGNDLIFQGGKNGVGYLLRQSNLGGMGAELFRNNGGPVCSGFYSAAAYAAPYLYGSCSDQLVALNIDTAQATYSVAWSYSGCGTWSPIVAAGLVWVFDRCGKFHGFDAATGAEAFTPVPASVNHFVSPSVSGGRVFMPLANSLVSYAFGAVVAPNPYHPITPVRVLDTRPGAQVVAGGSSPGRRLQPDETYVLTLPAAQVPADATAVVVNVGVENPLDAASDFVLVYPADQPRPRASTLNFLAGETRANLAQVGLAPGGKIAIYNSVGNTDVFVDLNGYYGPGGFGLYQPLSKPVRALDTRGQIGSHQGKFGPGEFFDLAIGGAVLGVPPTASAIALNLTEVEGDSWSYLAALPGGSAVPPPVSNLNFGPGRLAGLANRVIVKTNGAGAIRVYNSVGHAHILVDVAGYFGSSAGDSAGGLRFAPQAPTRIFDTRIGLGHSGPLAAKEWVTVSSLGGPGPAAAALNVAMLNVTSGWGDFVAVVAAPPPGTDPETSDVNSQPGDLAANHAITRVGGSQFALYNSIGSADVFIDLEGAYS